MAPSLRKSTNLETIIPLVKAQIALTNMVLDPSRIFASLMSDYDIMARAPADQFIAIKPTEFPVWEAAVEGGGNDVLWIDGHWEITYFLRYGVDQGFADDSYLLDPTNGILPKWSTVIHDLQLFDPVDASGVGFLAEPMRLAIGGFRNIPTSRGNIATWGRLKSYWEVKYVHTV